MSLNFFKIYPCLISSIIKKNSKKEDFFVLIDNSGRILNPCNLFNHFIEGDVAFFIRFFQCTHQFFFCILFCFLLCIIRKVTYPQPKILLHFLVCHNDAQQFINYVSEGFFLKKEIIFKKLVLKHKADSEPNQTKQKISD